MPGGNRTGPNGMGPMTGRGAGFCAGYAANGGDIPQLGRMGLGRGRGHGWRRMFYATGLPFWARGGSAGVTAEQQRDVLKGQAESLKQELDALNKRIDELDGK